MTPVFLDVDIPINGPADVICLILVVLFCAVAVRIIMGFFKKPTVKNKDLAGGDQAESESGDVTENSDK